MRTPRFYYKQNRLKQLRAFCHTAQTQSMSRAAELMFLSQPTVSLLIQALEKDMGTALFERHGPRIQLTTEGKILFDLSLPLVEGLEALGETFQERCSNQVSGSLHIAAGESTTLYLLPEVVNRFVDLYPEIRVKIHNVPGLSGLQLLRSGEVDFSVGPMLQVPEDFWYTPLLSYKPILITPPGHPLAEKKRITLQDINQYGLILPPPNMSTRNTIDTVFQQHNVEYNVRMEAGGWEVIKRYVEMGLGVSIVTSICLTGEENLLQIPLPNYFPERSYGLVLRRGKFISPAARRFIELLAPDTLKNLGETNTAPAAAQESARPV
ncbi:MAG: LysR family transcriptional regulator [Gammaproteobacteria bacterium]